MNDSSATSHTESEILFTETQYFSSNHITKFIVLFLMLLMTPVLYALFQKQLTLTSDGVIPFFLGMIAAIVLIMAIKLQVEITAEGVKARFFLMAFRPKYFLWADVVSAKIVDYKPFSEYGGRGNKYSFSRGWAWTVRGKKGFKIELKSGKKMLIGTQKPDEVADVLKKLGY